MVDMAYGACYRSVTLLQFCSYVVFEKVTVNRREDRYYTVRTMTQSLLLNTVNDMKINKYSDTEYRVLASRPSNEHWRESDGNL